MFRNHETKVSKLFKKNKKSNPTDVDLVDPLEIELQEAENKKEEETEEKKIERALRKARRRYTHEKKIIVFIMHTCRKLRNLAKQTNDFGDVAVHFMCSALLLLRKGITMNEHAIVSINNKSDVYGLDRFEKFLDSENCSQILKELNKDNKLYYTLLNHLQKKLKDELGVDSGSTQNVIDLSSDENAKLEELASKISQQSHSCFEYYNQK